MSEDAHVLVGFDPGRAGDDLVVVVLRQTPGEPWQLEHVDAPPAVDTSWIADLVGAAPRPAWNPPPGPPLADLVEQWIAEYQPPGFQLDEQQRAVLAAAYADAFAGKRLTVPPSRPVPVPRTS